MSEQLEGRVTLRLSQGFNRKNSRTLSALSNLAEFLVNPQVRVQSGADPVTSRDMDLENQEPTQDRFQRGPQPEADASICKSPQVIDLRLRPGRDILQLIM